MVGEHNGKKDSFTSDELMMMVLCLKGKIRNLERQEKRRVKNKKGRMKRVGKIRVIELMLVVNHKEYKVSNYGRLDFKAALNV